MTMHPLRRRCPLLRVPPLQLPRFRMLRLRLLSALLAATWLGAPTASAVDIHRADVKGFIEDISVKDSLDKHRLKKLLAAA